MITLSGGLGRIYVGHRRAMLLKDWSVSAKSESIGGIHGVDITGTASVVSSDPVHGTSKPTCIALRCNSRWWIWTTGIEIEQEENRILFRVQGHPEVLQEGRSYYAA